MKLDRRSFIKATSAVGISSSLTAQTTEEKFQLLDSFDRPDSNYHGDTWESINPGYWQIKDGKLRRRLKNSGEKARSTGFPYHYETHKKKRGGKIAVDYDPTLKEGILWNRHWKVSGSYAIAADFKYMGAARKPSADEKASWQMFQEGYSCIGLSIGGQNQFEGFGKTSNLTSLVWRDDHQAGLIDKRLKGKTVNSYKLEKGDRFRLSMSVNITGANAKINGSIDGPQGRQEFSTTVKAAYAQGYVGIITRGLADFAVNKVEISPQENKELNVGLNDCHACYALGDTLKKVGGKWQVRFMGMFRNDGKRAEIRISDSATPTGGWENVAVAGAGELANSDFRLNTAVIDATLPFDPAEKTLFYTIWKDGADVTFDDRVGTDGVGPGTGMIGDIPDGGQYVGRLPQLTAPYKLCGLSCHAINSGVVKEGERTFMGSQAEWRVRDQPTYGSYKHLEEYDFQVMLWEDDIWYLELYIYPPSTDDAYKTITTSICGPTSRWQMMRHWNILNPGDHDHGMDDTKGPEQLIIRNHKNLGQDPEYMQRNFKIVSHLMTGKVNPSGTDNPKRWRQWQMPKKDFTLVICDSRLWRSSQDTNIWDDEGWDLAKNLYSRKDPTRALLGEEQHAWLTEVIRTNSSPIICLTGLNGLHTIWNSGFEDGDDGERNRVAADYAGWVSAGSDRVLNLLAERDGVFTVYGDVHNGSIIRNKELNIYECSFGPIGRSGGRKPAPGFSREFKDIDGRDVEAYALYHKQFDSPELTKITGPFYWNFLEMSFNPDDLQEQFALRVRNMIDSPSEKPRGGGDATGTIAMTGLPVQGRLPKVKTLANASIRFSKLENGRPLRGTMSNANGEVQCRGFSNLSKGEKILMTANVDGKAEAKIITLI